MLKRAKHGGSEQAEGKDRCDEVAGVLRQESRLPRSWQHLARSTALCARPRVLLEMFPARFAELLVLGSTPRSSPSSKRSPPENLS